MGELLAAALEIQSSKSGGISHSRGGVLAAYELAKILKALLDVVKRS